MAPVVKFKRLSWWQWVVLVVALVAAAALGFWLDAMWIKWVVG